MIATKIILNKNFLNNVLINSIFNENLEQKNFNFYNYSNFKLLGSFYRNKLIYLKGNIKLKSIKENNLNKLIQNLEGQNIKQKIGFILFNKKMYRLYYFLNYYNLINNNSTILNYFIIILIKTYINFFDLTKFQI